MVFHFAVDRAAIGIPDPAEALNDVLADPRSVHFRNHHGRLSYDFRTTNYRGCSDGMPLGDDRLGGFCRRNNAVGDPRLPPPAQPVPSRHDGGRWFERTSGPLRLSAHGRPRSQDGGVTIGVQSGDRRGIVRGVVLEVRIARHVDARPNVRWGIACSAARAPVADAIDANTATITVNHGFARFSQHPHGRRQDPESLRSQR